MRTTIFSAIAALTIAFVSTGDAKAQFIRNALGVGINNGYYWSPGYYSSGYYSPGVYSSGYYSPGVYSSGYYSPGVYSSGYYNSDYYSPSYYGSYYNSYPSYYGGWYPGSNYVDRYAPRVGWGLRRAWR